MTISDPTPLERSVLRAIMETRPWTKEDFLAELDAIEPSRSAVNASAIQQFAEHIQPTTSFREGVPPHELDMLVIRGEFLSEALSTASPNAQSRDLWQSTMPTRTHSAADLHDRLTKPARDEQFDGYRHEQNGFELEGFRIDGDLDLSGAAIDFPIIFRACLFYGSINLTEARCRGMQFLSKKNKNSQRCRARGFDASFSLIDGPLDLSGLEGMPPNTDIDNNEESTGSVEGQRIEIRLYRAEISNILSMRGVKVAGGISAHGVKVGADCFFDEGFSAQKCLDIGSASIGGYLSLDEGEFSAAFGDAIDANGIRIGSAIFCRKANVHGGLNLVQAIIGSRIEFTDTAIIRSDDGRYSLNLGEARIEGSLYLNGKKFNAVGEVGLSGAQIGGGLYFRSGRIHNDEDDQFALRADAVRVGGIVSFSDGFQVDGNTSFAEAILKRGFYCVAASFANPVGKALDLSSADIHSSVLLRGSFTDGKLEKPFNADGLVDFTRANIAGNFMCEGARFGAAKPGARKSNSFGKIALNLNAATIGSDLVLAKLDRVTGAIDLRQAKARVLIDDKKNWDKHKCEFRLDGFKYDRIGDHSYGAEGDNARKKVRATTNASARKKWLESQQDEDISGEHFKPQPYTHLANVLMTMGHESDAKWILYWRDKMIARNEYALIKPLSFFRPKLKDFFPNVLTWVFNVIVDVTAGFGHRPQRAGMWAIVIWLIGAFVFHSAETSNLMRPAQEEVIIALADAGNSLTVDDVQPIRVNGFFYAADVFLPIVDLSQQKYWIPKARYEISSTFEPYEVWPSLRDSPRFVQLLGERFGLLMDAGFAKIYYWFSIVGGWLLTTVLVAALSGVLAKDK